MDVNGDGKKTNFINYRAFGLDVPMSGPGPNYDVEANSSKFYGGATAFVVSDAALAFDRFRGPLRAAPLAILGSYFPAQWLIALSVMR